ncbi:MAG: A/G-specific adenine glycosylase [Gammaproteobacteria bacterium]|nr:A/G-specific adenine glycosylase [Gammaproteobacteria bacterium]
MPESIPEFTSRILAWYRKAGRKDLPWQQRPTLYRVWVSEIMLQQTQVTAVLPYFRAFMARFPEIETLANASMDEVLHLWSGLGYYARARNLYKAARRIQSEYDSRFPTQLSQVIELPGVGRSTAGAILSLSLGQRHPILDGNVKRVLARCFAIPGWPGRTAVQRQLWELADTLTPERYVAAYNQGMMDLGAGICSRGKPDCAQCPVADLCVARSQGRTKDYPEPAPQKRLPVRSVQMLMICNSSGEVLLERRPPQGIWGGLWSLPECPIDVNPEAWCAESLGINARLTDTWSIRRHTFSHFHLDIRPAELLAESIGDCVMDGDRRVWYKTLKPIDRGLAAPVKRLIKHLENKTWGE